MKQGKDSEENCEIVGKDVSQFCRAYFANSTMLVGTRRSFSKPTNAGWIKTSFLK